MENDERAAARHPIRVVAARTGLTPDTLRAWERRYGLVEPWRSEGGQRLYTDDDVERLRLLARASGAGRQIGLIAALSTQELLELVAEDERNAAAGPDAVTDGGAGSGSAVVEAAMVAITRLDDASLRSSLRRAMVLRGLSAFLADIVFPLLRRIGDAWHGGQITPAHEHMASMVLREEFAGLLSDSWPTAGAGRGIVCGTLEGERHEFGVMAAAVAAANQGWRVLYLGADLPVASIADAARQTSARAVAVGCVYENGRSQEQQLIELASAVGSGVDILVGGRGVATFGSAVSAHGVTVISDMDSFVARLRAVGVSAGTS